MSPVPGKILDLAVGALFGSTEVEWMLLCEIDSDVDVEADVLAD